MSIFKVSVIKCVVAIVISAILATTLVAYAAAESRSTVTIIDGETKTEISTHFGTAEEILANEGIILSEDDQANLEMKDGIGTLTIKRAFPVHITVGNETKTLKVTGGTVADALKSADITVTDASVLNMDANTVLTKETYIDMVNVEFVTESYEETIPFTARVEYSSSLKSGEKKVTGGENGKKTVTVKKTVENGVVTKTEVVSTVVTKKAVNKVTVIGTKAKKDGTKPYSSIKTISSLKAPASLTLDSKGIPTKYTKKVTVEATAYTDHSGTKCASGVLPQTGYIAVNPKVIPYGTKMFIVSADGKYVYGYAIAADTGGFVRKRPNNVDLFFNTKSECRTFGRRDVVIYFL